MIYSGRQLNRSSQSCSVSQFCITYRMTVNGETLNEFTHNSLQEPTHLAVDAKKNRIIVADGVSGAVLVFNIIGELLLKV